MKKLVFIVISLLLSACGGAIPDSEKAPSAVIDPAVAALSDTIGNPDTVLYSAMLPPDRARAAADDYNPSTGKWFEAENGLNLIASYSSGVVRAGTEAGAAIGQIPEGRSVRFQITRRDDAGKRLELIEEYTADVTNTVNGRVDFSHKMPEQPNVNYLLSVEVISAEGAVEDTLLSPLFVPPNELNARLTVKPPAKGAETAELTLYNAGPNDLFLGYGYTMYRSEPAGWTLVPIEGAVPSIGIVIPPGESFHEKISLPSDLAPGSYRIVKPFEGHMTEISVDLAADFEIR